MIIKAKILGINFRFEKENCSMEITMKAETQPHPSYFGFTSSDDVFLKQVEDFFSIFPIPSTESIIGEEIIVEKIPSKNFNANIVSKITSVVTGRVWNSPAE